MAGRRPVEEAFIAGREARRLLVVPQRRQALEKLVLHATAARIPIVELEGGTLTALTGFDGHQGIALIVAPRRYVGPDDILARAIERGQPPFVLVLDSLEDPQNVGTLLRSAEAASTHGVIFPTRRQAPLSPSAVKASAGAVEHLLLAPVDDLAATLADLHVRGLRIVGADADAALTVREADLRGPLALVVGSEGQGLGPAIRRRCDLLVRIPMRGAVGSLNASVAGSILLYEATTQRAASESSERRPADGAVHDRLPEIEATPPAAEPGSTVEPAPPAEPEVIAEPAPSAEPVIAAEPQVAAKRTTKPKARQATGPAPKAGRRARGTVGSSPATPGSDRSRPGSVASTPSATAPPELDDPLLPDGPGGVSVGSSTEEPTIDVPTPDGSTGAPPSSDLAGGKPAKGSKRGAAGKKAAGDGHKGKSKRKGSATERG